jgi:anti-sigma B factor antagonist/stage II sporulation protein AA (anti-sigma F factor antagonist)
MSVGLHIELEEIDRKIILRLDGRLDAATTPVLERKIDTLINENRHYLMLDFLRVDYLSSAGMRLLLSIANKLKAKQGGLLLFSVGEDVMEIIKLAGFEKILYIFESEQEALQHTF